MTSSEKENTPNGSYESEFLVNLDSLNLKNNSIVLTVTYIVLKLEYTVQAIETF